MRVGIGLGITRRQGGDLLLALAPSVLLSETDLFVGTTTDTPSTTGAQVGLAYDRSQRLALGPDVVVNGGFDSDTVWQKTAGWTIADGVATGVATTSFRSLWQVGICPTGQVFESQVTVNSITGALTTRLGTNVGGNQIVNMTAPGTYTFRGVSNVSGGAGQDLYFVTSTDTTAVIDNAVARQVLGNHLWQSTASLRPLLQADGALRFDGVDDFGRIGAGLIANNTSGTIALRATMRAQADTRVLTGAANSGPSARLQLYRTSAGAILAAIGGTTDQGGTVVADGETATIILTWEGTVGGNATLNVNGTVTNFAYTNQPTLTQQLVIGCRNLAGVFDLHCPFDLRPGCFFVSPHTVSAAQQSTIINAWSAK
jgi:hypothetical protein